MDNRRQEKPQGTWLSQFLPNVLVEYWIITRIFTLILSTMKRKIKLSGNFASPTMLQSVAWLSFSVFGGSLKFENWKLQSIFNFCFSDKTFQIVDRTTQEGGGGLHSHVNFFPPAPSPQGGPLPFMRWENLFAPATSPPTQHFSRKEEEAGNSYLSRGHFSEHERTKDLVITQRKTHSEVSFLQKERFPGKKGLSSRSVRRFCLENGIHLHNRLSNDELEQCTRDVVARVSISFWDF